MNCDQHISTVGLLCWRAAQGFLRSYMWHACPRANYAQLPSSSKDARMDQSAAVFQAHGRGWYGESQSMRALPDHDLPCLACRSWKRSREVMIACMYVCMQCMHVVCNMYYRHLFLLPRDQRCDASSDTFSQPLGDRWLPQATCLLAWLRRGTKASHAHGLSGVDRSRRHPCSLLPLVHPAVPVWRRCLYRLRASSCVPVSFPLLPSVNPVALRLCVVVVVIVSHPTHITPTTHEASESPTASTVQCLFPASLHHRHMPLSAMSL